MDIWGMSVAGRKKQLHWIRGQILSNMSNENQADIRKHIKIRLMGSSGWEIDAWCQFSSFPSLSLVRLFVTPRTTAQQASPSITNSQSPPKPMSIELVMPSNRLILCHPLLLLPSIFPSIRVFSNESTLRMRWPKYWSFSFSTSPPNEHSGLISFRMDWLDLLAVQETLKSLLKHHSSKASILWHSAFLRVQLSHPYMTTGKTIALTRWTFVGKVMSLLESNHRCYVNTGFGSNNISLAKIRRIHSIWSACQLLRRLMSEIL